MFRSIYSPVHYKARRTNFTSSSITFLGKARVVSKRLLHEVLTSKKTVVMTVQEWVFLNHTIHVALHADIHMIAKPYSSLVTIQNLHRRDTELKN